MDKKIEKLMDSISFSRAECFDKTCERFSQTAEISDEQQERILSSVMRKAGFDNKETITVKRTKKRSRRFVGFIIAAALLAVSAVGAGASAAYSSGFLNGAKALYPDTELNDRDIENIAKITYDCNGEVLENTFEGLEFEFVGTLNDGNSCYVMMTVRRTDGEPFILEEGENYYFKYSGGAVPVNDPEHPNCRPGYWGGETTLNDDGSLTVLVKHNWSIRAGSFKAQLIGLYKSDMSRKYRENVLTKVASPALDDIYLNDKLSEENDMAYQAAIDEIASEKYDGQLTFTYTLVDTQPIHILPEDNEYGYEIVFGCMTLHAYAETQDFAASHDINVLDNEVTIYMTDGSSFNMQVAGGWGEHNGEYINSMLYCDYPKPIDSREVSAVEINGRRIDIK